MIGDRHCSGRVHLVLSHTDDFQVTWIDPARQNESWVHDRLHAPWVQPPLTQALFERIIAIAFGLPTVFINGAWISIDR